MQAHHIDALSGQDELGDGMLMTSLLQDDTATTVVDPNNPSTWGKVARNDACPRGSGKKFKHCHGAFA